MDALKHEKIRTNNIWMHIVEQGKGPLVLLLHGFPEFWFSWRHQITHLANSGYHVVAPDMRGYGDSDIPLDPSSYSALHLVGDIIGLLDHFGEQQAFVVGHDLGATVAWHLSLLRPDRVRGLVALGVPYFPRSPTSPLEFFKETFGDGLYLTQFQEPGRSEKAFARYDSVTVMKKFLLITSGDDLFLAPRGMETIDCLQAPSELPPWITEEELQVYADKFQQSGFTGGFNYYRAMDLTWELLAPWQSSKITTPTKFIVGDGDIGFQSFGTKSYVEGEVFKSLVPNLEITVIPGGHHFIHQERAAEVTNEILSFINNIIE